MEEILYLNFLSQHIPAKTLESIFKLESPPPARELSKFPGFEQAEAPIAIAQHCAEQALKALAKSAIQVTHYWDANYPRALKNISPAPVCLFYLGKLPDNVPTLAIVGTRKPNRYGIEVVARIVPQIQTRPVQIISGLAYGIDRLAHHHACESQIPNFAVLGSGVDVLYPPEHESLALRIIEGGGGILSEYPPGAEPKAYHFPKRNRIISAMADVVWIVQGTAKSGSLHTAKHALDQAKVVVATPGDIFSELSEVPHRLLEEGAHPVRHSGDLDLQLESAFQHRLF